MAVQLMAKGVQILCSLADEIDDFCLKQDGKKRICILDIGKIILFYFILFSL